MSNTWEVVVGNIGTVFSGTNGFDANRKFYTYVSQSKTGYGRASNEPVTLMKNGEPHKEYMTSKGKSLVGKRIEIPVHYDMWMRGARFGVVTAFRHSKQAGTSDYVLVKLDHPAAKRRLKVWSLDWDYVTVLSSEVL